MIGNRRCSVASLGRPYGISQIEQIKGVLPHAGLEITKDTKDTKGFWMIRGLVDWEMWGAAPRPGRGRALSRPENGEQRTENRTPLRATNKALYKGNQTSKPPNFQASNCPCIPGTSVTCQQARRGRAVRVRKAHVRPGGLRGHGGLRTPRFWEVGNLAALAAVLVVL